MSYCEVLPARFVTLACFVAAYRKICHSSSKIVIQLSSSLDVCIGVRKFSRMRCFIIPASDKDKNEFYSVFWVDYKAIGVSCVKHDYVGIE